MNYDAHPMTEQHRDGPLRPLTLPMHLAMSAPASASASAPGRETPSGRDTPRPASTSSDQRLLDAEEGSDLSIRTDTPPPARHISIRRSLHVQFEHVLHDAPRSAFNRFSGNGRAVPTLRESVASLGSHRSVNALLVFLPLAWTSHLLRVHGQHYFSPAVRFSMNMLAIIPLQKRFEWLGDEMIPYVGAELGELLIITLSNAVEGALAIGLLAIDHYRLLQITVIGVVLLHILLVPGVAFASGGARVLEQELHSGKTQLNHTLLTLGVVALVLPAAFFAALDRGGLGDLTKFVTHLSENGTELVGGFGEGEAGEENRTTYEFAPLLSDQRRGQFLKLSRGLAVLMLLSYVFARIYLHKPPPHGRGTGTADRNGLLNRRSSVLRQHTLSRENRASAVNPWFGLSAILVCVALMAVTAQFLLSAVEEVLEGSDLSEEWFGLIVLPFVSFAGDAFLSIMHFLKHLYPSSSHAHAHAHSHLPSSLPHAEHEESTLDTGVLVASGISIDLSIQFLLVWMPCIVLVAWLVGKPLLLLYDLLEIAALVAACLLVNFVTADAKTNWAEGSVLVLFYVMIALVSWFYPGQMEVRMFVGPEDVGYAVRHGPS